MTRPVMGIVSRFADQKGFDLIAAVASELMHEDVILTVLGTGERRYEELFEALANEFPGRVGCAHRLRQRTGAQDRGGRGHVSDALALRAVRT